MKSSKKFALFFEYSAAFLMRMTLALASCFLASGVCFKFSSLADIIASKLLLPSACDLNPLVTTSL